MEIVNRAELERFVQNHARARSSITEWTNNVNQAKWTSFSNVRQMYRSADYVAGLIVFNVGGNNYRIIARPDYQKQQSFIVSVMTHAEYGKWKP